MGFTQCSSILIKLVSCLIIATLFLNVQCTAFSYTPSKITLQKRADPPPPPPPPPPPTPPLALTEAAKRLSAIWWRIAVVRYSFTSDRMGKRPEPFKFAEQMFSQEPGLINNALARAVENWPEHFTGEDTGSGDELGQHLRKVKKRMTRWIADDAWSAEAIVRALVTEMNAENPTYEFRTEGAEEAIVLTPEQAYTITLMLFWHQYLGVEEPKHAGGVVVYERGESSQPPQDPPPNPCTTERPPGVTESCVNFCTSLLVLIFASCLRPASNPPPPPPHLRIRNATVFQPDSLKIWDEIL